jgi:hypothetical protein
VQTRFLEVIGVPPPARVLRNFPYRTGSPPYARTSLLRASLRNARQFIASRRRSFRDEYRPDVLALLARAERTTFLAGSCGLEILVNLELPSPVLDRVDVFAFGPVARCRPATTVMLVQGRQDWLSRWYFTDVDHRVAAGHLAYLEDPGVQSLGRAFVAARAAGRP